MYFLIEFVFFVVFLSRRIQAFEYPTDHTSLLDLKRDLVGGSTSESPALSSWNSSLPFCMWQGVTCGRRHRRVTVLNLAEQNLDGFLSPSVGNLTFLRVLSKTSIGVGSFGSVYKGVVENEMAVAVKVLNLARQGALKSFEAECKALSKIRHRNLLMVLSACASLDFGGKDFLALVFKFMPNGSLDSWLHESRNLTLGQRVCIAVDIACAMEYLHHQIEPPMVHCDLKPSNVLLDTDMVAHVGDFGLAKLLHTGSVSNNQSSSFAVKGTVGYVPPEYGMGGYASTQGDAYSFGILLLELITGKRPTDDIFKDGVNLHTLCSSALSNSNITDILDSQLLHELDLDVHSEMEDFVAGGNMLQCIVSLTSLGVACTAESPNARMDMGCALKNLYNIKKKLFPASVVSEQPNDTRLPTPHGNT